MTEAPSGVKLHFSDGTEVDCTVTRAPEYDRKRRKGTVEYYVARPVSDISPALTYHVIIGKHPPMTGLHIDTGQAEAGSLMRGMQPKEDSSS